MLISAVAFVLAATAAFLVYPWILSFLKHPYCQVAPTHCGFYITGPLDGLALRVKIAAYGGLFLSSPVLLWELWRFITPGLNPKEKRYAIPFIVASIALFALGCVVAYVTFPHALNFLDTIGGPSLHQILDPDQVPEPHRPADDGVRTHLRVPGAAGLPRAGRVCCRRRSCLRGGGGPSCSSWWWPGW